ncbi:hypothetical protein ACUVZB_005062 [Citrobacter freundii]|uniref:hypothetical protein n=1 Tax=Citrobacter freundii TaxID=546 RepID=UPI001BCE9E11|nr:hypothetical protein [Citrobacter freundii]HBU6168049.1 hypothetical protein [Citrobacter freundii]HBV8020182.1 hypothetical protein [Citrobacter freundii]HEG1870115.1 hypothetical protein [Citrobacter freundii]
MGEATDSQGLTANFTAGYQAGWWRVQNGHIVAQTLQLSMNPVDPHAHNMDRYPIMEDGKNAEGSGGYSAPASYTTQATESAGGHTPSGSVAIGSGAATEGVAFFNPYYGKYIWMRTA